MKIQEDPFSSLFNIKLILKLFYSQGVCLVSVAGSGHAVLAGQFAVVPALAYALFLRSVGCCYLLP